jgi:hypothetical protein
MSYRQFVVPDDEMVLEVLGVLAEVGEEAAVRTLRFSDPDAAEGSVELTYDVPGRSVRCRWVRGGAVLLDVFREGATALSVASGGDGAVVEVRFETESLAGVLRVAVQPRVSICDELLLC